VAHHILDTFFAKMQGRPLPPAPTPEQLHFDFADPFGPGHMPGEAAPEPEEAVNETN
jgi:hypothetical protein